MPFEGSRIEVYRDGETKVRWRAVAADGTILADSGEGYDSVSGAVNGLRGVGAILMFGLLEVEGH